MDIAKTAQLREMVEKEKDNIQTGKAVNRTQVKRLSYVQSLMDQKKKTVKITVSDSPLVHNEEEAQSPGRKRSTIKRQSIAYNNMIK